MQVVGVKLQVDGLSSFLRDMGAAKSVVKDFTDSQSSTGIQNMNDLTANIGKTNEAMNTLAQSTTTTVSLLSSIGGVISPFITTIISSLGAALPYILAMVGAVALAFMQILPAIIAIIGPIANIVISIVLIRKAIEVIKTVAAGVFDFVKNIAVKAFETIKGAIDSVVRGFNFLKDTIEKVGGYFKSLIEKAKQFYELTKPGIELTDAFRGFREVIKGTEISLSALRFASRGTVADIELLQKTNMALAGTQGELKKAFAQAIPEYLMISRAAARATGESVEYMFDSLVRGTKRTSPRIIDNALIMVRATEAYDKYAASIGKSADALSDDEKRIAIINETLVQGRRIMAQFGTDTLTVADSVDIINAQIKNLSGLLGTALYPAFKKTAAVVSQGLLKIVTAFSEGGHLYQVLVDFATVVDIVMGGVRKTLSWFFSIFDEGSTTIRDFVNSILNALPWLKDILSPIISAFSSLNENLNASLGDASDSILEKVALTYQWGVDFIFNFAEGIIDGAASVLVEAINYVGAILTSWFAPGSPPKIAPMIDKWGMKTMEEWLKGFTKADFSLIKDVMGNLEKVFEGADVAKFAQSLVGAMGAGKPIGDILKSIAAQGNEYGKALVELISLQFKLATSSERLARAEQQAIKSRQKVSALTQKYNDMLRAGASQKALDAQLAQINTAEEEYNQAQKTIETTKEQEESLKEQVANQQDLLDILVAISDQKKEDEKPKGGGKEKPSIGGVGDIAGIGGMFAGFGDQIEQAVDDLNKRLTVKMLEIRVMIARRWEEIKTRLITIWTVIKVAAESIWEAIKRIVETKVNAIRDLVNIVFAVINMMAQSIWNVFATLFPKLAGIIEGGMLVLKGFLYILGQKTMDWIVEGILSKSDVLQSTLSNIFQDVLNNFLNNIKQGISGITTPSAYTPQTYSPSVVTTGTASKTVNVNVGNVNVNNGTDEATFMNRVKKAVKTAITT